VFAAFLRRVLADDDDLLDFMQRWVGYTLTGRTSEHAMLIPYGTGANGKSTLAELLRDLLGDYATVAAADTFLGFAASGSSPPRRLRRGAGCPNPWSRASPEATRSPPGSSTRSGSTSGRCAR
jgi:hypothetical protein